MLALGTIAVVLAPNLSIVVFAIVVIAIAGDPKCVYMIVERWQGSTDRRMSPTAATIAIATVRFTPVIVISRLTAGSPIATCAISRSRTANSSASVQLPNVPLDGCPARPPAPADGSTTPCRTR